MIIAIIIITATTTELTVDNISIILFSAGEDIIVGCTVKMSTYYYIAMHNLLDVVSDNLENKVSKYTESIAVRENKYCYQC